jgi:hypothetical protein
MKNYSIVRVGNERVVQANKKSIPKIANRRRKNGHGCGRVAGFAGRSAIVAGSARSAINRA